MFHMSTIRMSIKTVNNFNPQILLSKLFNLNLHILRLLEVASL